jgi:hypothetical protein
VKLFSCFFFVSHNHDFFLLHASSVVGRLLFQGNNGVGLSRFLRKILPGVYAGVEIFLKTACGLTFTARQEAVNTFAREQ